MVRPTSEMSHRRTYHISDNFTFWAQATCSAAPHAVATNTLRGEPNAHAADTYAATQLHEHLRPIGGADGTPHATAAGAGGSQRWAVLRFAEPLNTSQKEAQMDRMGGEIREQDMWRAHHSIFSHITHIQTVSSSCQDVCCKRSPPNVS